MSILTAIRLFSLEQLLSIRVVMSLIRMSIRVVMSLIRMLDVQVLPNWQGLGVGSRLSDAAGLVKSLLADLSDPNNPSCLRKRHSFNYVNILFNFFGVGDPGARPRVLWADRAPSLRPVRVCSI